jgi:hypothetical protein
MKNQQRKRKRQTQVAPGLHDFFILPLASLSLSGIVGYEPPRARVEEFWRAQTLGQCWGGGDRIR